MIRRAFSATASILVLVTSTVQAQAPTEYQIKAAFIYNFAKFVDWPSLDAAGPDQPIVVGILGEDPFGQNLENVINGKTANGRRLMIKRFSNLQSLAPCHILFVSSSQRNNLQQVFGAVAGSGVLTIGETDTFADTGGIIQLGMLEGRVRLVVNQAAAERAGLKISAKLLGLARVIRK
jgi:hypothetical protein